MSALVKRNLLLAGAVIVVMASFLGLAAAGSGPGFPLDDAWIHQTYARNLARDGRLEYVPGQVSAGSTSPLWTILLAAGYRLRLPYLWWAYLLGGLSLWLLAGAGMRLWRLLWPGWAAQDWLAGLVLVLTWPLVWAAASGMETLLFAALRLWLVSEAASGQAASGKWQVASLQSPILLGFFSGLLILLRPEGVLLLLLLVLGVGSGKRGVKGAVVAGTAVLPLLPYFAFNLGAKGTLWPNTSGAKQMEYAVLLAEPIMRRFARLLFFSLGGPESGWRGMSGAHLLLLPGLLAAGWLALRADWRERRLFRLLPLLWAGGHVALYAWRLPVTYQHGRYLLTAVPVWVLYGLAGWRRLLGHLGNDRVGFLAKQVARLTFAVLLLAFLLLGGQSYAQDVAFIEGEMVATARWLAANTPSDALIAAHDIGAIGYFAERPLLDLAGLISPEIISLLADETAVARYALDSEADYLVTAPGWPYELVVSNEATIHVFSSDFAWTRENGLKNTAVYQLNLP